MHLRSSSELCEYQAVEGGLIAHYSAGTLSFDTPGLAHKRCWRIHTFAESMYSATKCYHLVVLLG